MKEIRPKALNIGDVIGVFSPSWPAHIFIREKYEAGIRTLTELGFKIKEGFLTQKILSQGYRTGTAQERAKEFMDLILDKNVKCIISIIGGHNSSSLLPYLDFNAIRRNPKIICGYSDMTSIMLSILTQSGLRCFYGPAVAPSFGESMNKYTIKSFIDSVTDKNTANRFLYPPEYWSNHFIDASKPNWQSIKRNFQKNEGWKILNHGTVEARVIPVNLDTLLRMAGTKYFPNLRNKILMIEEADASYNKFERNLSHLKLIGVFEYISGLIISKPENADTCGANFTFEELILEFIGKDFNIPVISNFDCGHTYPMITLQQNIKVEIIAEKDNPLSIQILEPMVI